MKVPCHVCREEDDDSLCPSVLAGGEAFSVHDECLLEALEEMRALKEDKQRAKENPLSDLNKSLPAPPIQGGASESTLEAGNRIHQMLEDRLTPIPGEQAASVVSLVHDSLVLRVKDTHATRALSLNDAGWLRSYAASMWEVMKDDIDAEEFANDRDQLNEIADCIEQQLQQK